MPAIAPGLRVWDVTTTGRDIVDVASRLAEVGTEIVGALRVWRAVASKVDSKVNANEVTTASDSVLTGTNRCFHA
jgi:orotate phosphoribosyltransferase